MEASTIIVAIGILTSCSEPTDKKEYDTPKALCGVSVDQNLIAPFLPSGERIEIQEKNPSPNLKRCQVNVDGKMALIASEEWWEGGDDIIDVAKGNPEVDSAEPTDDGTYIYSRTGGVGRVKSCTNPDHPDQALYTTIRADSSNKIDESTMQKLIAAYTKAVGRSSACQ
ncbi:hypothetical protein GCM10010358_64640 [Streptomyces minutiscleroticus]|uniref:Uncharacterized protein n=2 Tax=Streptomyces minutiscleroticus TaxID=68238 RepID=A0A918U6V2_9ACTN|nr:hypothetical protein GCM10010358_64640 [Streptomyces minutiscleroticus]